MEREQINYTPTDMQAVVAACVTLMIEKHNIVPTVEVVLAAAENDPTSDPEEVRRAYRILLILGFIPMPTITDDC